MPCPGEQVPSVSARPYRLRKTGCGTDGRGLKFPRPSFVSGEVNTDTIRTKRTDTDGDGCTRSLAPIGWPPFAWRRSCDMFGVAHPAPDRRSTVLPCGRRAGSLVRRKP